MLDRPEVLESSPQTMASLRLTIPRDRIRDVMGPGLKELHAALAAQGVVPVGPWFTHHFRMDPLLWDFEICLPVARPIQPAGRVVPGTLRAARVARTVYHGPYEGLPDAWREFDDWIRAQGHAATGEFWEVYLVGPESGAAPAEIQTQLNRPLAGAR